MRNSRLKLAAGIIAGLLVVFIGWQLVNYFQHRGQVGVNILAVPADSTITVDGKPAKAGKVYLSKGSHVLVASRPLFDNDSQKINTADITKDETIYLLPAANSSAAKTYLAEHPDIQKQREAAGGAEAARLHDLLLKKYPILAKLPYQNLHYKIDYAIDSNQNLSLTITTFGIINGPADYQSYLLQTKSYRQEALNFLQDNGIKSGSLPITYIPNIANP